jgi:toxin ParE1/3/4
MGASQCEGPAGAGEALTVIHYTEEAENDLFEIGVFTWAEWGEEQFVKYVALLRETCEDIIPRKHRFARAVPKRPELLRWRCERHVIYFRKVDDGFEIIRILHDRMLPSLHL